VTYSMAWAGFSQWPGFRRGVARDGDTRLPAPLPAPRPLEGPQSNTGHDFSR